MTILRPPHLAKPVGARNPHYQCLDRGPVNARQSSKDLNGFELVRRREIRTLRNLHYKLLLSPLSFLNYTKTTRYEALEKNAVSKPKMPQLGNLQYSCSSRKASLCWEIFPLLIEVEVWALG